MAAESSQTQEMTAVGGSGGPSETEGSKKRIASDARGSWGVGEGGWPMPVLFGKREAPRKTAFRCSIFDIVRRKRRQFRNQKSSLEVYLAVAYGMVLAIGHTIVPEENDPPKDPTAIERANLLNMVKLSIKSLIESSYQVGRTLDKDFAPLQQFLIVMEHVLKHGLKAKKSILSTNKHVWGPLEAVEKLEPEATEINNSVRELPQIKTYPGKARAWLRLAMMQKRLADYVKTLVEKKDVMGEFYEPFALLMEEEGMVLAGLLVGLNVIDCNFCVKEDDFDSQLGVIDFSMYLKDPGNYTDRSPGEASRRSTDSSQANLTAVLDQKNYVEELNRHLNATVTNLQARIENLEKDNSNLSEKLAMANNRVLQLQEEGDKLQTENTRIKGDLEKKLVAVQQDVQTERETYQKSRAGLDDMYVEAQKQLRDETQMRLQKKVSFAASFGSENPGDVERADTSAKLEDKDVEKELELQISMKQEMEMAMKLLEKDIHEKQDMIVGLRKQLDDIKAINIDMYKKFQAAEGSLKHKTEMLVKLEEKCTQMSQTIKDIEQRLKQAEREKMGAEEAARKLGKQLVDKDTKRVAVETDLKIEREWRTALQQDIEKQKEVIQELQTELKQMEAIKREFQSLQDAHERLKQTCEDQEKTLAEMGHKLSESKLKMEDMKEALKDELKDKVWTDDKDVTECRQCEKLFSVSRRKHHCRNCGGIFCNDCSDNKMPLPSSAKPVRVCDHCHTKLLERYSAVAD